MKFKSNGMITKDMLGDALFRILGYQVSRPACQRAISELVDVIKASISEYGMTVTVKGFGTMGIVERKAKKGRNIKTGETIDIDEREKPAFHVSKEWCASVEKHKEKRDSKSGEVSPWAALL